ncbi:MAG: nitrous oxide-stimulated promoter family protein [Deltaproteobacteria bacterium]|nr:nitrous oxide-stimulated promoter family protein [Deltaproteobacteria bacterium]
MLSVTKRIALEKTTIKKMVALYCRHLHRQSVCPACQDLLDYAYLRIEQCPHHPAKPQCSQCLTHCYKKDKREAMKIIMRYSGPRILFYHPLLAIRHFCQF